jgi:uncharacterized protein (TIGR02453 family)
VPAGFAGFPSEGMQFLSDIERNNKREWFQPRKSIFEDSVKQPMRALVAALNAAMKDFAPDHVNEPDKAIMRFYRDTRFSKDKSPYKTNIAANFPRKGGERHEGAGYYLSVSHKAVAIGGGVYMPMPETLLALRTHIAENHKEFEKIAASSAIRKLFGSLAGDQLTRVPKGFPADHAAAGLLRFKQFVYYVELSPDLATTPALLSEVRKHFRALTPFVDYLNAPLMGKRKKKVEARDLF